jgi:hypothetical protein
VVLILALVAPMVPLVATSVPLPDLLNGLGRVLLG